VSADGKHLLAGAREIDIDIDRQDARAAPAVFIDEVVGVNEGVGRRATRTPCFWLSSIVTMRSIASASECDDDLPRRSRASALGPSFVGDAPPSGANRGKAGCRTGSRTAADAAVSLSSPRRRPERRVRPVARLVDAVDVVSELDGRPARHVDAQPLARGCW